MKKLIFILFFSLLLTGCKEKEVIEIVCESNETLVGDECIENEPELVLDPPTNISFVDGLLNWDDVDDATGYEVKIGTETYFVDDSEIDLSEYLNGTYSVVIIASAANIDSEESDSYEFTINIIIPIEHLDVPLNVRYDSNTIVWDLVENATSYELTVNSVKYQVSNNNFDFSTFENNDYLVTVIAKYEAVESSSSDDLVFTVNIVSLTPTNITIVNNTLSFDEMDNATSYTALINGVEYTLATTSSSLTFLDVNNSYTVSVRSNHLSTASSYSDSIDFEYYEASSLRFTTTFYKLDNSNLVFNFTSSPTVNFITSNAPTFTESCYSYIGGSFTVNAEYLMTLAEGTINIKAFSSDGIIDIYITIDDNRKPLLTSSFNITYVVGQDVVLDFELYGGTFVSLDGNGITTSDYSVSSSAVTINASYIDTLIASEPSRSMIILGYYLTNDQHIIIGYVFITVN